MTSTRVNNILQWCRTHWNWVVSAILHVVIVLALIFSVSSTPKQYQVISGQQAPQIVNAQMVTMSQVMPPQPKAVHRSQHKERVKHKPKPKPRIIHKVVAKKQLPKPKAKVTHKVTVKKQPPKPKPVTTKSSKHNVPNKKAVDKTALASLRNMALSGIAHAAEQQRAQAVMQQRWQTEKQKYLGLIQQLVRVNWNNPVPGSSLQVVLLIRLSTTGVVESVTISQSSGNSAFDRQALLAVQKSSPLPLPKDPQLAQQFTTLRLPFSG